MNRRVFVQLATTLGLSLLKQRAMAAALLQASPEVQASDPRQSRWNESSIRALRELQEKAYSRLGKQLGLGDDPLEVYSKFSAGQVPLEWISAKKFHDTFDKSFGSSYPNDNPDEIIEHYVNSYRDVKLPTPYEEHGLYSVLLMMADSIEEVAQSVGLPIPRHLLFGTLPTGAVGAEAKLIPGTRDYIVVFQFGLFMFCYQMACLIAIAYPPLTKVDNGYDFSFAPALETAIKRQPEALAQFKRIVYCYVVLGNPRRVSRLSLDPLHLPISSALLNAMETFVMGHEYTHVIYRHIEKKLDMKGDEDSIRWSRDAEFSADELGLSFTVRALHQDSVKSALLGADYFLVCMDLLEQVLAVFDNNTAVGAVRTDHPPFSDRRKHLREILREMSPGDDTDGAIMLADQQKSAIDWLRDRSINDWVTMRKEGIKPFPIWG